MLVSKSLLSSVLLFLSIAPVLTYTVEPMTVGQCHEQYWAERVRDKKKREEERIEEIGWRRGWDSSSYSNCFTQKQTLQRKARELDVEISQREHLMFDKLAIREHVCKSVERVFLSGDDIRRMQGDEPLTPITNTVSIYDMLQDGSWNVIGSIRSLEPMVRSEYEKLYKQNRDIEYGILMGKARTSVVEEVMRVVDAMTAQDFLGPNNDRLRVLRAQKAKVEQLLEQETRAKNEQHEVSKGEFEKSRRSLINKLSWGDEQEYSFCVNLVSTIIASTCVLIPRVSYVEKKLDALRLKISKVHKDRLCRALLGAYVTQLLVLGHYGLLVLLGNDIKTQNDQCIGTFSGPWAMVYYMLLDLGYNYSVDSIDHTLGHTRIIKKCNEIMHACESRARKRFQYYDYWKQELSSGMKMFISLYGARQRLNSV